MLGTDSGETLGTGEQGWGSEEKTPLSHMARVICSSKSGPGSHGCPHSGAERSRCTVQHEGSR